jgi:protein-tyrosine-phosphatase
MSNNSPISTPPKILFVCLGNICRSPMAHAIANDIIHKEKMSGWIVDSAGTSAWHRGEQPDYRTLKTLLNHGINFSHKSRQLTLHDMQTFDHILVMDDKNMQSLYSVGLSDNLLQKVALITNFDPLHTSEVQDPYYGGDTEFEAVYNQLMRSITSFIHGLSH